MHHAPAVECSLVPRRLVLRWILALWVPGSAAVAYWFWLAFPDEGWKWLGLALAGTAAITAVFAGSRIVQGKLVWDGLEWAWTDGGKRSTGVITLALDFQRVALLSCDTGEAGRRRVWMLLSGHGTRWTALRRALFALQSGQHGSAKVPGVGVVDDFRRT